MYLDRFQLRHALTWYYSYLLFIFFSLDDEKVSWPYLFENRAEFDRMVSDESDGLSGFG